MENLIEQYPKAITTFIVGVAVVFLTGRIPAEYLAPEIVNTAQTLIGGLVVLGLGRFTRLKKTEATLLTKAETKK